MDGDNVVERENPCILNPLLTATSIALLEHLLKTCKSRHGDVLLLRASGSEVHPVLLQASNQAQPTCFTCLVPAGTNSTHAARASAEAVGRIAKARVNSS